MNGKPSKARHILLLGGSALVLEDEGAGQPQQNLPTRAVNDEHPQHLTRMFFECTNAADSLGQLEERKVTRTPLNRLLNLGTRTIGGMLKFLERGGVPTHEVAESFCEATAKVPVILDRHMLHKSASHEWLTSATDNLGQIIAFAQNRPGMPAALTDPRLPSARIALLQERDRHGTEYLLKMNELVLQVEVQQGPQDVVEAIIQLSCDFMRDFRLKTRLDEIGAAPRSDEEWKMFSECASALEEWTWKACKLSPRPKLPVHLLWLERKLKAFAKGNPNRVPPALHKASARITTLVGAKKQKCSK